MSAKRPSFLNLNVASALLTVASFGLILAMILDNADRNPNEAQPEPPAGAPEIHPAGKTPTTPVVNEAEGTRERALPPLINDEDELPTITMDDMARALAEHAQAQSQPVPEPETKRYIYRWQDQSGQWHFANHIGGVPQAYRKTMLMEEVKTETDPLIQQDLDDHADESVEKLHKWQQDQKQQKEVALSKAKASCQSYRDMKKRLETMRSKPPTCATMMILDLYEQGVDEESCLKTYRETLRKLEDQTPKAKTQCLNDRQAAFRLGAYSSQLPAVD